MKPNHLTDIVKNYAVPAVVLVVVILMIPYVLLPQLNKIAESSKIINQDEDRLQTIESKAEQLEELERDKDKLDADLRIAESALPLDKSVAKLTLGVQQLAINSGLNVKTFKIQPRKIATEAATKRVAPSENVSNNTEDLRLSSKDGLVFQMILVGNTNAFKSFLTSLETAKRLLLINEFTSTSSNGTDFEWDVFINAPFGPLPKLSDDQITAQLPQLSDKNKKLLVDLAGDSFDDVTAVEIPEGETGAVNPF